MGFFKQEKSETDRDFSRRVRVVGLEAFKIIVAVMLVAVLVFKFPNVKETCLKVEKYIRGIFFGVIFAFLDVCQSEARKVDLQGHFDLLEHGRRPGSGCLHGQHDPPEPGRQYYEIGFVSS